jgi:hypothetical protein
MSRSKENHTVEYSVLSEFEHVGGFGVCSPASSDQSDEIGTEHMERCNKHVHPYSAVAVSGGSSTK